MRDSFGRGLEDPGVDGEGPEPDVAAGEELASGRSGRGGVST